MNTHPRLRTLLLAACLLAAPMQAQAFKIDTHIWIGQQVINDLADDGRITVKLNGRLVTLPVPEHVRDAILANRTEYLIGNIGPDAIPDVVVGQTLVHPGSPTGWKTNDWLNFLLAKSQGNPRATAFSYGYLGHAAADTFSHTYVNQYAGDVFDLVDEGLVEQRHVALESFISRFNPPLPNAAAPWTLVQPGTELANFLRDTLVYDGQAAEQNKNGKYSKHLSAYRGYRNTIRDAAESPLWTNVDAGILQALAVAHGLRLTSEEARQLVEFMNNEVLPRLGRVGDLTQEQLNRLNAAAVRFDAAQFAALNSAVRQAINLNSRIAQKLAERAAAEGQLCWTVFDQVCHWVACCIVPRPWPFSGCALEDPFCREVCNTVARLHCPISEAAGQAAAALITAIDNELHGAGGLFEQQLQWLNRIHDEALAVHNSSVAIANRIFDLVQILGSNTSPVKALLLNWVSDLDLAMAEYIKAATNTMINTMNPAARALPQGAATPMFEWWDCYHLVIAGVPAPIGTGSCGFRGEIERIMAALENIASVLGDIGTYVPGLPTPSDIRAEILRIKADAIRHLQEAALDEIVDLLPQEIQDLLVVLSEDMTDAKLQEYFTKPETVIPGKRLIMLRDVNERVRREMNLVGNTYDPERYAVIYNSVVLAKLALLDSNGLALLAQEAGVPLAQDGTPLFANVANAVADAFASIDGNHQWMSVAPPRPNATGAPYRRVELAGYPFPSGYSSQAGFVPWKIEARNALFRSLFIGPLSPGIESPGEIGMPEVVPADYPYRPCRANPFPDDEQDQTCVATLPAPDIAFAATFFADTDGDGSIDTITAGPNALEIFHPSTGMTSRYPMAVSSYSVVKVADTDGRPGSEVVVAQGNSLIAIDDARKLTRAYNLGAPYTVHFAADTDGLPGDEIVASAGAGKIAIVADARGLQRVYDINVATPGWILKALILGHADTNNRPGEEITISRNDNQLLIIDDALGQVTTYPVGVPVLAGIVADTDGQTGSEILVARSDHVLQIVSPITGASRSYNIGQPFQISGVADTNGIAGNEVVLSTGSRIVIVDDIAGVMRPYPVNGSFSVQTITDLDGFAGAEVCYLTSATGQLPYGMVIDRLGRRMSSSDPTRCAAPLDRRPLAKFRVPALPLVNTQIRFDASESVDPDGFGLTYKWTFGDGSPAITTPAAIAQHLYSQLGTYTATLVVNDGVLDSEPVSVQVVVRDAGVLLPILELLLDEERIKPR